VSDHLDTSFDAVRRRLAAAFSDSGPIGTTRPLEIQSHGVVDAPAVKPAEVIEGSKQVARVVDDASEPRFAAFLDGSQLTLNARWVGVIPVVHGTVSAGVRVRRERRLTTWGAPIVRHALYAPMSLLDAASQQRLRDARIDVVDTLEKREPDSEHPFALQELAYKAVLSDRERAESELAVRWVEKENADLFVDGGISGNAKVAKAANVIGVIKSHQTLYADADGLGVITALKNGERSSVFKVEAGRRTPVVSWYLRIADRSGRDPFWGLVRVEVAVGATGAALTQRADDVSRWIFAERLPLALPDARWDKMAYGIRDAEEYLRAIQ
jgi:hypothetical protein